MININSEDINTFEDTNKKGKFGHIYKVNDNTAYKIYHPTVISDDDYYKEKIKNPNLKLLKTRYYSLLFRSKYLKYSDGIKDLVKIDGHFGGVKLTYYNAPTLYELKDEKLDIKVGWAYQLLRNAKELMKYQIYSLDYKLDNLLLYNGEVKIIDLDDIYTKVTHIPNISTISFSKEKLGKTICNLFCERNHFFISSEKVENQLGRKKNYGVYNLKTIENYLKDKSVENKIVFVDENSNLSRIDELVNYFDFKVVYLTDNSLKKLSQSDIERKQLELLIKYRANDTPLYDFASIDQIEKYPIIENVGESYILSNIELKKVYKKTK